MFYYLINTFRNKYIKYFWCKVYVRFPLTNVKMGFLFLSFRSGSRCIHYNICVIYCNFLIIKKKTFWSQTYAYIIHAHTHMYIVSVVYYTYIYIFLIISVILFQLGGNIYIYIRTQQVRASYFNILFNRCRNNSVVKVEV